MCAGVCECVACVCMYIHTVVMQYKERNGNTDAVLEQLVTSEGDSSWLARVTAHV
jgi:hypothetical protein